MKNKFFSATIVCLIFCFTAVVTAYAQTGSLAVTFAFKGIVDGYDHQCKTQVWVDDQLIGESPVVNESRGATFNVNVPYGTHTLRIINLANYEDTWEEHTLANDYSLDCLWEGEHTFSKKKAKVFLLFDLDDATKVSWSKMPK